MSRNTEMSYLYRDGDNYKKSGTVVFRGEPPMGVPAFERAVRELMDEGDYFTAHQVSVPEVFLWEDFEENESDHAWHELEGFGLTDRHATDPRTPEQFLEAVRGARAEGWRPPSVGDDNG